MRPRRADAEPSLSENDSSREIESVPSGARCNRSVLNFASLKIFVPTLAIVLVVLMFVVRGETEQAVKLLTKLIDAFRQPVDESLGNAITLNYSHEIQATT